MCIPIRTERGFWNMPNRDLDKAVQGVIDRQKRKWSRDAFIGSVGLLYVDYSVKEVADMLRSQLAIAEECGG